jgi:hypothetical protein
MISPFCGAPSYFYFSAAPKINLSEPIRFYKIGIEVTLRFLGWSEAVRCYFMRGGHIADVEVLEGLSDQEAIEKSRELFAARKDKFDGFEVWERDRMLTRESAPPATPANDQGPSLTTSLRSA